MTIQQITKLATSSILQQANALQTVSSNLQESFANAILTLHAGKGRIVVSGIGKSGIIAQKIVATLNSTGSPSIYMHAADAIHGDLGMLQNDDIIIIISKSGQSEEIKVLTRLVKNFGNTIIAICGNADSFLATESHFFLNTSITQEACPNNLAPTTSTTAQMVMGDAIAICLLELNGFTAKDFAKYHPGGSLGKQLYMQVQELSKRNEKPQVLPTSPMAEVLLHISTHRLGAAAVVSQNQQLLGIITDGDIRRMLQKTDNWLQLSAQDCMNQSPKTIDQSQLAVVALEMMRTNNISQLIVLDKQEFAGFIHLHDLLKEGLV
jgi:arabinose-5-phosphate isomerase